MLGRFTQPDTLVPEPGNPQALNRYAYTLNNPLRYTDPSGHCPWCVAGKVLLQTAVDVGIDYLIARATGTDFNLVSSLKVNALVNVTTLGIGSTVTKLRHLGKLATLTATHGDDALRIGAKVAEEVAEEAAEQAGKEIAQEAVKEAPIVIGERMKRVQTYAERIGGKTINDFIPTERWSMEANETWIRQMRQRAEK